MSGNIRRKAKKKTDPKTEAVEEGQKILRKHPVFRHLAGEYYFRVTNKDSSGKETAAVSDGKGNIYLNKDVPFTPSEWAYTMAHCMLHNVFGHFEGEKMNK